MGYGKIDICGQRFGRLVVVEFSHSHEGRALWKCLCDCGVTKTIEGKSLRNGNTTSCGCYGLERRLLGKTKHGFASGGGSREYNIWSGIIQRCTNPNDQDYRHYGGRGVSISPEWRHHFSKFLMDLGKCPAGYTIERIDNDGDYCKKNCRWASRKEQANNTRFNRIIESEGISHTLSQWAEKLGVCHNTIAGRLKRGASVEEALSRDYKLPREKCKYFSKLTPEQVTEVVEMRINAVPYKEIAHKYNMSVGGLEKVISRAKKKK